MVASLFINHLVQAGQRRPQISAYKALDVPETWRSEKGRMAIFGLVILS
jgi:hypothetical protein